MAAMRWLAVAAILVPAEASYESRQCSTHANTAACSHVEGMDAFWYGVSGDTCFVFCMESCLAGWDTDGVPVEGTTLTTSCVPNAKIWGWYVIIFMILFCCWCTNTVLNCIFCCGGKGSDMH